MGGRDFFGKGGSDPFSNDPFFNNSGFGGAHQMMQDMMRQMDHGMPKSQGSGTRFMK